MIKKISTLLFSLTIMTGAALAQPVQQQPAPQQPAQQQPAPPKTHLKVGQQAPEFSLTDSSGKSVKLSDFKGKKNVVLAFYVLAFTGG